MLRKGVVVGIVILVVLGGVAAYVLRPPAAATGDIEAIPLAVTAVANAPTATAVVAATAEPLAAEEAIEAGATASAPATAAPEPAPTASGGLTIFQINSAGSQARFELDEDLRGSRTTVVGTTNQVAGEVAVDLNDLSQTQVGIIQINARTLATDNNFRNRAIQNEILDTGAYELITFAPTAITGLPASAAVGETVNFTIEGNLTIRDITNRVTFAVQATAVSLTQITGTASTIIPRDAYGLTIPSVPNVANVEEEVELIIAFVAEAA